MRPTPADCHDTAPGHDKMGPAMVESGGPHAGDSQAVPAHHPAGHQRTCNDTAVGASPAPDCCLSGATPSAEEQAVLTPVSVQALAVAAPALAERCDLPLGADGHLREGPLLRAPSPLYTLHSAFLI